MISYFNRLLSIQAPCVVLLLAFSFANIQVEAAHALRKWESTGIVNATSGNEFSCRVDSKIVTFHVSRRCDGKADCKDGSDEKKCTECRTPFSLNTTDGYLECFTASALKTDRAEKKARENAYHRSYDGSRTIYPDCAETKLEQIWKDWKSGCADDEIDCSEDSICLPAANRCDGVVDCPNYFHYDSHSYWYSRYMTEEDMCESCKNGAKLCKASKKCIPVKNLCDGSDDCSDGSDEADCTAETCRGALCGDGKCIRSSKVCDGVIDCDDASDEQSCLTSCGATVTNVTEMPKIVTCSGKKYLKSEICTGLASADCNDLCSDECDCDVAFKCSYSGKCISKSQVCDGKQDCRYGDDEKNCLAACAKYPFFSCINNGKVKCMSMDAKCDGVRDCSDGKDEKNCSKCPANAHKCDGGCIPGSARCDGVKDCKDGSDERNCSCEDCTEGRLDTYSCERSKVCMKRSAACRRGKSRCANATARDELFCQIQSNKKNFKEGEDNSRL